MAFAFIFISFFATNNVKAGPFSDWMLSGPAIGNSDGLNLKPVGQTREDVADIAKMTVGKWKMARFLEPGLCESENAVFDILKRSYSDGKKLEHSKNLAQFKICSKDATVGYLQSEVYDRSNGYTLLKISFWISEENQNQGFATEAVKTFIKESLINRHKFEANRKLMFCFTVEEENQYSLRVLNKVRSFLSDNFLVYENSRHIKKTLKDSMETLKGSIFKQEDIALYRKNEEILHLPPFPYYLITENLDPKEAFKREAAPPPSYYINSSNRDVFNAIIGEHTIINRIFYEPI